MRRADARTTPAEQVRSTVERWRTTSGRDATVETDDAAALPTESSYELVAILGEALENVRRHTPEGTPTRVTLGERDGWVLLTVRDEGPGIPEEHAGGREGHFGVLGMSERAARIGGSLQVLSRPGAGTTVEARIPALLTEDSEVERAVGLRDEGGAA